MPKKLLFESRPCPRCGGSGEYSYCTMYGRVCFKCNGTGAVLTKRGSRAQAYLNDLRRIPAEAFKPGDLILSEGFSCGSFGLPSKWGVVESVTFFPKGAPGNCYGDRYESVVINSNAGSFTGIVGAGTKYRKGFSAVEKKQQVAEALEFQATLGKNGQILKQCVEAI